ncbi:ASCH domain-containing protein [Paenibacillus larvae]|uniref:ASCH domain-containing protein n=1 Tax=Paenibacillus larvae subsp. larvae TaxID=147375 RepID=A0A2L1U7C2_9BACL|nr:ASCH domain-containing protein [Paenibacillus larvae]AVF28815.1 50S ribosomal protein L22/unknown domain fusion protein [Paenibacillus larvae subsp. larvae]MCY9499075.1 ASCH domain-containing protein [Paenibacillus larvae]MCY9745364.1 ASCH domain-containing protein [Paenibacillus larvae]MCY9750204.1 ASCH domain-containing protein [Paenibacillus larvae]MDR5608830.1 ASCH domain-containing protein [Paenibacillus larvae]
MKVLLSIKPEFVEKIFSGEKKYEYRKSIFKKENIDTVVVYSTMPEGKIVGEFKVEAIIVNRPDILWEKTKDASGISNLFFKQYFENRVEGYAIKISDPKLYDEPIDPKLENKSFHAPQSFCYIT